MSEAETVTESKADRFVRIAEKRVTKVTDAIEHLHSLANKDNYEYTEKQVKEILAAIYLESEILENLFGGGKKHANGGFKFAADE